MSRIGCITAGGIAAVLLAGCAASTPAPRNGATATASAISLAHDTADASGWERAWLTYLGGSGRDNWELVVQMTTHDRQAVRFTGSPVLPGNTDAPTIAGTVGTEIFVKVDAGASTQFWTIFKLVGGRIRQVTMKGQPARLAVGGSVTHQSGFRCDGAQFVTVGESTEPPAYTTWTYQRDTYTWSGAKLVPVSSRTGQVTSNPPGTPPAAYTGVSCGHLPQLAPPYKPAAA
jgi:hypothetical protein